MTRSGTTRQKNNVVLPMPVTSNHRFLIQDVVTFGDMKWRADYIDLKYLNIFDLVILNG